MVNAFEVDSVTLSDYFTQDISGKSVLAGVYASELVFASTPTILPPLIITVVLKPNVNAFDAELSLSGPTTKQLVVFDAGFKVDSSISEFARAIFNIQLPLLKFDGPGPYSLEIGSKGKKPHFRKKINIMVGTGTTLPPGSLTLTMRHIASGSAVQV